MTSLLYSGYIALLAVDSNRRRHQYEELRRTLHIHPWIALRNFLAAPVVEEIVFRRQAFIAWQCSATWPKILIPAILFSLAHGHRAFTVGLRACALQLLYTLFFGVYAGAVYIHFESSLVSAVVAHCMCNVLGLPDFDGIARSKFSRRISLLYCFTAVSSLFFICRVGQTEMI